MVEFINYVHDAYAKDYRGNQVALPWGCDFAYSNAIVSFRNMERIVDYINKHNTVNMKLVVSTP